MQPEQVEDLEVSGGQALKPVSTSRSEALTVSLNSRDLGKLVGVELGALKRVEDSLLFIETTLFGASTLAKMTDRDLVAVYSLALQRKEMSHRFLLRIMELGLKSSFLARLFEETAVEELPPEKVVHSEVVRDARSRLQKVLDGKLKRV